MVRILVTGREGQVGFELQRSLALLGEVRGVGRAECDLSQPDDIRRLLREFQPQLIVNSAAYTAVDKAESEGELAYAINGVAPGILGEEAARLDALVVHFSTDYVFDGSKQGAYAEQDATNPQNVYGKSKLAGEEALRNSGAKHLIFRTSWVFGAHGGNFAKTMLRLAAEKTSLNVVADQWGAPTSAALLADATAQVLTQYQQRAASDFPFGLYHLTASGSTNWHAYAQAVIRIAHAAGRSLALQEEAIQPIATADYPLPARRPMNSRLDTRHFQNTFGLVLPDWTHGLEHVMQQILQEEQ